MKWTSTPPNKAGERDVLRAERDALKVENMALRQICTDLHWMARRYADGRSSYATSLFNERTRSLLAMKVQLNDCDGTIWARDAMGRNYDGLTEEEAREGE